MEVFKTHPSVRVKGTEDNYEPVACSIPECPKRSPHMHCPFCLKTDSFIDPVILKAHYRVKHVDKGIEFAGLKILRCCDQCNIVGSIKNNKEFKGAHWHCYNCRNGFNRRDEALKHYKTHFRNPMTTFQIQITHDINQHMMRLPQQVELDHVIESMPEDGGGLLLPKTHPWVVSNETIVSSVPESGDLSHEDSVLNTTNDNSTRETNLTSPHTDTVPRLILVEPQQQVSDARQEETQYFIIGENGKLTAADPPVVTSQQVLPDAFVDNEQLERDQLLARITELQTELTDTETLYQEKIVSLQNLVDEQQKKITALEQREQELLNQLRQNLREEQVSDILSEMRLKQEELLKQCLSKLKRSKAVSSSTCVTTVTDAQSSQSSISEMGVADTLEVIHSSQTDCLNSEVVNHIVDSTSNQIECVQADECPSVSVKAERSTSVDISENPGHSAANISSDVVEIDVPMTPDIQAVDGMSEVFIDTGNGKSKSSKVVKLPLSRFFTSTASGSKDLSGQGEVYFLVHTSDGSEVPLLDGQNGSLMDKECLGQASDVGITSSSCNPTDTKEICTHSDDIIETGDYVSTSNVDVITEVSTTGSCSEINSEHQQVLDNVDYNPSAFIVPSTATPVSEHQYAVIEQNVEVQGDIISSDPIDVKVVAVRKGKRKASTSPDTSPTVGRSKRQRKPLVKESL